MMRQLLYFLGDFKFYLLLVIVAFFAAIFFTFKVYKSKNSLFRKKVFTSLIFTGFILIVVFSFFEAYFRYVYDEPDGLGFLKVNERWHKRHITFNGDFFRDKEFILGNKDKTIRIGALGDSVTFGGGIENPDDRYTNILEKKLKEKNSKVVVYNLGRSGLDTQAEIQVYKDMSFIDFNIVVWQYYLNDAHTVNDNSATKIFLQNQKRPKVAKLLSNESYLFDFIYWRLTAKYNNTYNDFKNSDLGQYKNEEVFTTHKKDITNFLTELKNQNKKVIVVIFPFVHLIGKDYPVNVHNQLKEVFTANGAEVIDLYDDVKDKNPKELTASLFDAHPNEAVHKIAADRLFAKIAPLLSSFDKPTDQVPSEEATPQSLLQ